MSGECKDFIKKLLDKRQYQRLGSKGGLEEILAHPWFRNLDRGALERKELEAPEKPVLQGDDPFDVSNFDQQFTGEEPIISVIPEQKMFNVVKQKDKFKGFS